MKALLLPIVWTIIAVLIPLLVYTAAKWLARPNPPGTP